MSQTYLLDKALQKKSMERERLRLERNVDILQLEKHRLKKKIIQEGIPLAS